LGKYAQEEGESAIEPAEVDAALALLESEREVGQSVARSSALEFAEDLLIAGLFFTA